MISILTGGNAKGDEGIIKINVAIDNGTLNGANDVAIESAIDNYRWVVNDSEYHISTKRINCYDKNFKEVLNSSIYQVLIIDGFTDEYYLCALEGIIESKEGKEADDINIKNILEEFIEKGGGYIGRCDGSHLPPTCSEDKPETIRNYYCIKLNDFLFDTPEVTSYMKSGFPFVSQYMKMCYSKKDPGPVFRLPWNWDPDAIGVGVYNWYNLGIHPEHNGSYYNFKGVCMNMTNLNKAHPILKDYWGDGLYTMVQAAGGFPNLPSYVDVLACYPSNCFDTHPNQNAKIWRFTPSGPMIYYTGMIMNIIGKIIIDKLFQILDVDDLSPELQSYFNEEENVAFSQVLEKIVQNLPDWKQTTRDAKTGLQNLPSIIAFEYGSEPKKGRVVLSAPHIANGIWPKEAYINDSNDTSLPPWNTQNRGLYHWELDGDWIDYSDTIPNIGLWWYQRREAAWASNQTPDVHLPPVYNRSQVVDIEPYLQNSSEFPIICCVGRENNSNWNWSDVNLTLCYKFLDGDHWTKWMNYSSTYDRPYNFTFNASKCNGTGMYRFCSVLNTTENGTNNWTCDDYPPKWDTQVHVSGSCKASVKCALHFLYAQQPVQFDGTASSTKTDTTITSYQWDFGDGTQSNSSTPTHTFTDDGVYNVTLEIENSESQNDSITTTIKVHNNPPEVDFEPEYKIVFVNEQVNFTDNSSDIDGNISQFIWDFGDGTNSTIQNSNHTFTVSGLYDISLEVTDDDNDTNIKIENILVIDSLVNQSINSTDNKWNKVQEAVDNSTTNNYIYIENGTYSENISIGKSITLIGEDRDNVVIQGSISLINPYDFELPNNKDFDFTIVINMSGNQLNFHCNNDSTVGENYSSSNLVYDYSGEGNNGINNGALWTTIALKGAGALTFNGNNNSINLSSIPALTGENITVSAWVYWTHGTGTRDPILSQSNASNGYCLYINCSNGKPVFQLDDAQAISSNSLSTDKWHHIVGTHNETTLKIYVNGIPMGESTKNGPGINTSGFIGYDNISQYYNGTIDEVIVWNRTLSDDEIRLIYNSNNGIFIEGVTFQDSNIGVTLCNHSEISYCHLVNHTVGVVLNNSSDIRVHMCNITDVDTGIKVTGSNPESFYFNRIVDVVIDNVTSAIVVDNTTNLYVIRTIVNGSSCNLSFTDCNASRISMIDSNSVNNVDPDAPNVSGPSLGEINVSYTFSAITNDSNDDQILYRFDWGDGSKTGWLGFYYSNETVNASHTWMTDGNYQVKVKVKDVFDNESITTSTFIIDILPPVVNSVISNPDPVGFGGNVTITADVSDNETGGHSGVKTVKVNISSPADVCLGNFTMTSTGNDTYEYVFNNTWTVGQYNYTVWACDNASNNITLTGYCFNISAQANISVCTVKDEYGDNETVNLTDPPSSSYMTGYRFLDDGKVLHIWNRFDNYYFNTSNGIQFTNHKDDYWSHNVLMLGYYNNDVWNLIYRTDNLSGFNKNIKSDNETYVNATLWKDLTYGGYDFRLAIRYYLGVDDNELTIIPYIKNIDNQDIPYILGFGWEMKDIQVDMTSENDYIEINGTSYFLNQTLDETYTNLNNPCYYIKENKTANTFESLYLRWNENLNYRVKVESREGQYNAPVTLGIKIGTLNIGQEKYTSLYWHDASEITYYFDDYDSGETWATNPSNMVDGSISNYASTGLQGDIELCDNNTCTGTDLGTISKVEIRAYGYYSWNQRDIILRPVFNGVDDLSDNTFETTSSPDWSRWFDITNDHPGGSPPSWSWNQIKNLDCDVETENTMGMCTLYCSKVEIRVTYNNLPGISSPYPVDGSTGICLTPILNITVSDPNGDSMDITWLSNSSGTWFAFGTNSSVSNGTYHQVFSNATVNGEWWFWKVNVSDTDGFNVSSVFEFYTGNQSKIENTGTTKIKGYLLIQVQFYNTTLEEWVLANDTVNETTTRTLTEYGSSSNSSSTLALDTIFNGLVNTSNLLDSFGNGTYRIYAAFRDPDGAVLVCNDESLLEATYEFTITSS